MVFADAVGTKLQTIKVFLVDDNRFFLESLSFLLSRQSDMEVIGTSSRARGTIKLIEDNNPDVIILDFRLPDRDGISLLEEIKSHFDIPVIMLSMYEEYKERAVRNGAFAYLVKGEGLDALYQAIRGAYRSSQVTPEKQ
ncbi:MAG: response regulator transcription factor [Candidatus Atribacteria bacterium]|nr:response regulator transcription factor [Candidatus Atribacteria bacterium]